MGENTLISWCDHTFNGWVGCTKVSPACDGCYAEHLMANRFGRVEWGAPGKGIGTRERTSESNWRQPLKWNRAAASRSRRPFVFCSSLSDVFDNKVPLSWRHDLFALIRETPNLVWLLLSKRPQNMIDLSVDAGGLPANAALGSTCEDQQRLDMNGEALLLAKALLHPRFVFLSCEPLLGPLNMRTLLPAIEWVITGGETDQGAHMARPSHPEWFRSIRDQCAAAGTAFHHKQNGEWRHMPERAHFKDAYGQEWRRVASDMDGVRPALMFKVGKKAAGRLLDGVEHNGFPEVPA